jgi:hypothetical protein
MAVFNQTPGGQAPFAATLPILALGTVGGPGVVNTHEGPGATFLLVGGGAPLLQATIPALALGIIQVANARIKPFRDAYLGGDGCPPVLTYPLTGQRGLQWRSRTNLY